MAKTESRYEVVRVANIKSPADAEAVFFEIHELHTVEGEEIRHRNADLAFATREEAQAWIERQSR